MFSHYNNVFFNDGLDGDWVYKWMDKSALVNVLYVYTIATHVQLNLSHFWMHWMFYINNHLILCWKWTLSKWNEQINYNQEMRNYFIFFHDDIRWFNHLRLSQCDCVSMVPGWIFGFICNMYLFFWVIMFLSLLLIIMLFSLS